MKQCIKWFESLSEKKKQWLWFVSLWCGGLATVSAMGYVIKWMMGV